MAEEITLKDLKTANYDHYLTLVSITILYFDYLLTFVAEVERVWTSGRLNWAIGLFYVNRYVTIFGHVPVLLEFFWVTSNPRKLLICRSLQAFHQYLAIVIQLVVACMLVMRVYALYEGRRFVVILYVIVISAALSVGCWSIVAGKNREPKRDVYLPVGCGPNLTHEFAIRLAVAWGGMLVFDILVFAMTLYKSLTLPRLKGVSLLSVLFRDGAMYFGVIAASNLSNILTFVYGTAFTRGVVTTFTNVISSVMISRLVLNLRHPSLVSQAKRTSQPDQTDELAYPDMIFTGRPETMNLTQVDSFDPIERGQSNSFSNSNRGPRRPNNYELSPLRIVSP